jgi:hypothetical protein
MEQLPPFIGREIFGFIMPEPSSIIFVPTYSKYETAKVGENVVAGKNGKYLCRISKKNGKHRYYLSQEVIVSAECNGCGEQKCYSDYCGSTFYEYGYDTKYVGKDVQEALFCLFSKSTE